MMAIEARSRSAALLLNLPIAGAGCYQLALYLMATAHRPTTAKDGRLTHGLSAERGQAEAVKQTAPSPLASETTAGTTTKSTSNTPRIAAAGAPWGFNVFVTDSRSGRGQAVDGALRSRSARPSISKTCPMSAGFFRKYRVPICPAICGRSSRPDMSRMGTSSSPASCSSIL